MAKFQYICVVSIYIFTISIILIKIDSNRNLIENNSFFLEKYKLIEKLLIFKRINFFRISSKDLNEKADNVIEDDKGGFIMLASYN